MAMSSLLIRIPRSVLKSPTGFRSKAVQGIPPAMASRFMGTKSQGEQRHWETFDAEQMIARLRESIKVMHEDAMNDQQMLRRQLAESDEDMKRQLNELTRSLNNLRRAGTACVVAVVAIPLTMTLWSKYQA